MAKVNSRKKIDQSLPGIEDHPLFPIFVRAIEQCTMGKGERHGGDETPFLKQPWTYLAQLHGRGFLTGQACKKLGEAASGKSGDEFVAEVLGAIVYAGMAILKEESDG